MTAAAGMAASASLTSAPRRPSASAVIMARHGLTVISAKNAMTYMYD